MSNLLKIDTRPDGTIELQYAATSVPCAVVCHNGGGSFAVGTMMRDAVNEHATMRDALREIDRLTVGYPLMSRDAQTQYEHNPHAAAHRVEVAGIILRIRELARRATVNLPPA